MRPKAKLTPRKWCSFARSGSPGYHSPTGPISKLGAIVTTVDARRVQWVRDRANVYAFHIPLTPGVKTVSVDFQYLSPIKRTKGRIEISDKIADPAWYEVLMYPAGYFSRDIPFDTTITLPNGWKYATALETATDAVEIVTFKTTTLDTLVDSTVYAGSNYKRVDLLPTATDTVHLDLFADSPEDPKTQSLGSTRHGGACGSNWRNIYLLDQSPKGHHCSRSSSGSSHLCSKRPYTDVLEKTPGWQARGHTAK